jgi:hypothetical protein
MCCGDLAWREHVVITVCSGTTHVRHMNRSDIFICICSSSLYSRYTLDCQIESSENMVCAVGTLLFQTLPVIMAAYNMLYTGSGSGSGSDKVIIVSLTSCDVLAFTQTVLFAYMRA